ncbi:TetR/AcrR family transcriptional regulator [Actinobaculum suis]|uniref:TetR/AcrR family transcriptional regulator n=1 Tax=Actinobaculum suis TaxID=1657 RepID=A0AAW9HQ36_9ACTO|nr:TetR/AcrR family transcriptional regulator [Actinobaculum suis]MDY5153669.1 TetR/AcrR family transcriptional regulator [Actinobaculum suis]
MTSHKSCRQEILAATRRLILTKGVSQVSISDIVRESGTSAGAIYHHFENKPAIFKEIIAEAISAPRWAINFASEQALAPHDILTMAFDALDADPERARVLVQLGAAALGDGELGRLLKDIYNEFSTKLLNLMQTWAREQGNPEADMCGIAPIFIGLIEGYAIQSILFDSFNHRAYRRQAVAAIAHVLPLKSAPASPAPAES